MLVDSSWADQRQEVRLACSADSGDPSWTSCLTDLGDRDDLNDPTSVDQNYLFDLRRKTADPSRVATRILDLGGPNPTGPNHRPGPIHLKSAADDRNRLNFLVGRPRSCSPHLWPHRCARTQRKDADQEPQIPAGAENQKDCVVP